MRDRNLEKNIQRTEDFVERWKQLSQFLDRGFKGQDFEEEEEAGFLDLKSVIAQRHEQLKVTLGHNGLNDDKGLRLLNSVPSLHGFKELPEGMVKKITNEWHSEFISLQALLGRLKGRKLQLASISSFGVGIKHVFSNPLVILLVMLAAGYGVYRFAEEVVPKIAELGEKKP